MSKLNPGLYSSDDMTWQTPPSLVNALLAFEGRIGFDLDPACTVANIPALTHYFYPAHDGLALDWGKRLVLLNPPYGNVLKHWVIKAAKEAEKGASVWAVLPVRTETHYYHDYVLRQAGFIVFLKGKVSFLLNGENKGEAGFPVMLAYFGSDWQEKAQRWVVEQPVRGTLVTSWKEGLL